MGAAVVEKSALLESVTAMAGEIAERAPETERNRGLPSDIVQRLRAAGLFRMMVPRSYGGEELTLLQAVRVIEALAKADASAGWNAMVIFGFNAGIGRYPRAVVNEVLSAGPDVVMRGALAPLGRAVPSDGGYTINGRWPFASGSYTPEWVIASCIVMDGDKPLIGANGAPDVRMALIPGSRAEFLDTWDTVGLKGTSSHDFVVRDTFVTSAYTTNFFDPTVPPAFETPLLKMPFFALTPTTHSAVVIGIAQGALDDLATLARTKRSAFNPTVRLAEDSIFKHKLGELAVRLAALCALMDQQASATDAKAHSGEPFGPPDIFGGAAMTSHTHVECVEIVNAAFALAGSTPVYSSSPLQRRWRDVRCAAQHIGASPAAYGNYGALLAGEPPPSFFK
jgi:alkylation response protein AidB-like acyl-CoA dehydrogenase